MRPIIYAAVAEELCLNALPLPVLTLLQLFSFPHFLYFYPTAAMLPTALLALGLAAVSPAAAADSLGGSIVEAGDTLVSAMMVRRACRLPRRSECLYWDAS